jgi:hypothetical protein
LPQVSLAIAGGSHIKPGEIRDAALCKQFRRPISSPNLQSGSLTAYKDFLALWKDADPDVPILKQAKAEYPRLQ